MNTSSHLLALVLLASGAAVGPIAAATAKPNLVFIMTDDQASWGVGAYGNKDVVTPNLDQLARAGVRLRNAFVPTPVCSPSRATFLTGRYGVELGITDFLSGPEEAAGFGLPPETTTWPEVLQRHGYRTGLIGKWHLGTQPQFHPTKHGFHHFFGFVGGFNTPMDPKIEEDGTVKQFKGPVSDLLTDNALRFVEQNRGRPFALSLHYREPHLRYGPMPEEDNAALRDRPLTVPQREGLDPEEITTLTRGYYTAIHAVDRNVGRLLAKLDELRLADNTIVIFTSDHGYMIGHHGLHTKGNAWWLVKGMPPNTKRPNLFEESIRIPFFVRWPGAIPAGTETSEPFSTIDTFATVLGLMGIPLPPDVKQHGADYSPLLRGRRIPWRDATFGQYDLHSGALAHLRMIRTDRWKLVRHYLSYELDELYDLQNDPHEERNLYRTRAGITTTPEAQAARAELQERLYAWQRSIDDPLIAMFDRERDPEKK
jgi:uncharacterized sulfatase